MYPEEIILPIKEELISNGFEDLNTKDKAKEALGRKGITLVFINSVCGCSASGARPAVIYSSKVDGKKPDYFTTSFAGFDIEAVNFIRENLVPFPPSSPSIALFRDGELVHFLERHHIEGHTPEIIASNLIQAFEEFC